MPDPTARFTVTYAPDGSVHITDPTGTTTAIAEKTADTHGRIPYHRLEDHEREALHDWCRLHQLDPNQVPADPDIEQDGGEWRIGIHHWRDGHAHCGPDGDIATVTVRRAVKAPLPWRMAAPDA